MNRPGSCSRPCPDRLPVEIGAVQAYRPIHDGGEGMKAIGFFLAAGLLTLAVAPARADECRAGRSGPGGDPLFTPIDIDLASRTRLDAVALPEGTNGIVCARASIVPRPEDVRVLIEWRVALGLTADGPRALWIWARDGRLETQVNHGDLSAAERAAVDDWLRTAQPRYQAALARR
jgi:hypothetical protein